MGYLIYVINTFRYDIIGLTFTKAKLGWKSKVIMTIKLNKCHVQNLGRGKTLGSLGNNWKQIVVFTLDKRISG